MKYCFVFVCQGGPIEPQALLLAASLTHFIRCDAEIVACIPEYPEVKAPTDEAIAFLHLLGVRIETITNPVDSSYLIANKMACLKIDTDAELLIFLDSDMLCVQEFHGSSLLEGSEFSARLTDFSDLSMNEWKAIYAYCKWGTPTLNYKSMVSREAIPLSLNSGFLAVKNAGKFQRTWVNWAIKLNDRLRFPKTRPFLDQIALSFTVMELGLDIQLLDQTYNYSSAIYPIDHHQLPYFVHYYESIHLLGDTFLSDIAHSLMEKHSELRSLLKADSFLCLLH